VATHRTLAFLLSPFVVIFLVEISVFLYVSDFSRIFFQQKYPLVDFPPNEVNLVFGIDFPFLPLSGTATLEDGPLLFEGNPL